MELRYEDGWLLEMDADAGVYDVYDEKRCLLQQVTGNQRLLLSGKDKRPMLYIRKDKQTFVVKPRALPDTGVVNFRDLGGYVNRDGQQVRYDCFYRSAPLCDLQKDHVDYLHQLHIQHILDLRSDMERKGKEDIHLREAKYHPISAITFDKGMDVKGSFDFATLLQQVDVTLLKNMMMQVYRKLPFDNPAYRLLVQVVLEEEVPVLFHCSAGKDRTGFGAALLLLLLDVDEETILNDYVLSNQYRKKENAKIYAQVTASQTDMEAVMGVQKQYLRAALQAIKQRYQTYEAYFQAEFGIDETQRKHLKQCFLYPLNM